MMVNAEKIKKLHSLIYEFQTLKNLGSLELSTEATARSWIESLLGIFGWNSLNPYEVDQEVTLGVQADANLLEIDSLHRRPDYLLCAKSKPLIFIDAKKIGANIQDSKSVAFQIRSYGWSAGHPYAVVSSFNEFAIYDCRYKPNKDHKADVARVYYGTFDKFVDDFDILYRHIDREFVLSGQAFDHYKSSKKPSGTKALDEDFSEHIRDWRLKIANSIYSAKKDISLEALSEFTQVVIDRLIFCRVAEGLKIVESERLLHIGASKDAWNSLRRYFENDCKHRFGGFLFEKVNEFRSISVADEIVKQFIESLYYPNPYRFDVITPVLLGNIYERYLGRCLQFKAGRVVDDFKEEYQKTKGAVYTPEYVVKSLCEKTLDPIAGSLSAAKIRDLKFLDPSCGSGSFLLGIFDYLETLLISKFEAGDAKKAEHLFWTNPRSGKTQLRISAKRDLINRSIFGVDIDPQAIEIARLSISLKALEAANVEPMALMELGLLDSLLLDGIGQNIKLGNSLVDSRIYDFTSGLEQKKLEQLEIPDGLIRNQKALKKLKIFDWKSPKNFKAVFDNGGFDAVVGNPPYIEVKHYKKHSPIMHQYLSTSKHYKSCVSGKTDLSMPFIERSIELLKSTGRLGFIVQTRFFKTDYGMSSREAISDSGILETIIDFGALKVFEKRTTYTSILIFNRRSNKSVSYCKIDSLKQIEQKLKAPEKFGFLKLTVDNKLGKQPWFFVDPKLRAMRASIAERNPLISQYGDELSINVGLQVLFKTYYLIKGTDSRGIIRGANLADGAVKIERDSCKAFIMNRNLFPFKSLVPDSFVIFPYEISAGKDDGGANDGGEVALECKPLSLKKFGDLYPLAGAYLRSSKSSIQEGVETLPGANWHLYKYEKNHVLQSLPKILIPSTSIDTTAIFDEAGDFYQDNVRVNSIVIEGASSQLYKAVCATINSSLFDCLAKITSESLDGGYIQFNKQFIMPVSLPIEKLIEHPDLCAELERSHDTMTELANAFDVAVDEETRDAIRDALEAAEITLNDLVENELYELTEDESVILNEFRSRLTLAEYIESSKNEDSPDLDLEEESQSA